MSDTRSRNKDKNDTYHIESTQDNGSVLISDSVVASIAGIAATEVDGVVRLNGNITNEIVSKIGMNVLSKGIRISIDGTHVSIDVNCELKYGSDIPKVSREIQEKVKQSVENMTGLEVVEVNIYVAAVTDVKE